MNDAQDIDSIRDREQRFRRLAKPFRAHAEMYQIVNAVLDEHALRLPPEPAPRDLGLLVGAALGKALKTYNAIHELCLLGHGEDALVLLRSNVNLLINIAYIVRDAEPHERALDLIAFSFVERTIYLTTAHPDKPVPATLTLAMPDNEITERSERWKRTSIKTRAQTLSALHYVQGYKFYSSIEHSDAMALNGYIAEWNEVGPRISAVPSDDYVEVTLAHSAMTLADLLVAVCAVFSVEPPDLVRKIDEIVMSFSSSTA
jgi:hypothetical protein